SDAADATTRTFEARYVLNGALANAPLGSTVTLQRGAGDTLWQRISAGHGDPAPAFGCG
ncbi:efflux transporter periplasmic adaptor subunit, partial [Klebsiella pneumoniae]